MRSSTFRARALAWLVAVSLPALLVAGPAEPQETEVEEGGFHVNGMCMVSGGVLLAGAIDGGAAIAGVQSRHFALEGEVTSRMLIPRSVGAEARDIVEHGRRVFLATETGVHRVQAEFGGARPRGIAIFDTPLATEIEPVRLGSVGQLWVIGAAGNAATVDVRRLDRRTEPHVRSVSALPDGLAIRIEGVEQSDGLEDPSRYTIRSARDATTEPSADSPPLELLHVDVNTRSGTEVKLRIPQLTADRLVSIDVRLPGEGDAGERTERIWYTLMQRPGEIRPWREMHDRRVLVFSRTTGFRHGSIPDGWRCFRELGIEHAFTVRITEDPTYFTAESLAAFDAVVFLNTTGDVLDEAQQAAFQRFVEAGGGFLGVHSASDTEYDWPWYGELVAAYFKSHPRIQDALVRVQNADHPATSMLPAEWPRTDEWYNFREPPRDSVDVLLALDQDSYEGSEMPRASGHPIAWCHSEAGGRAVYTAGGHTKASYTEPLFRQHLLGALSWAAGWSE